MRGWLRYFALNAQLRTGLSAAVLISAIIAAVAAVGAATFLLVALFVWLADLYDGVIAGVVIGCAFALIALIALLAVKVAGKIEQGGFEQHRALIEHRSPSEACYPIIAALAHPHPHRVDAMLEPATRVEPQIGGGKA